MTCRIKEKLAKLDKGCLRARSQKSMELFIIFAIYYSFGKATAYMYVKLVHEYRRLRKIQRTFKKH